jgi:hypothetical protein
MNLLNFTFSDDHIGVEYRGRYLDLHNNFNFVRYARDGAAVQLHWRKTNGDWVPDPLPRTFTIAIAGVTYFDVRGALSDCLDEFGFFDNDTLGKVDYNGTTWAAAGHDVLVLRFVGGGEVAMQGQSATASSDE